MLNRNPKLFFLQYHQLGAKLQTIRDHIVQSLRGFDFDDTTPVLQAAFPAYLVGEPSSGIDDLFSPPRRGRPKKRKVDADVDYVPPATLVRSIRCKTAHPRPAPADDSSSTDEKKIFVVSEILLEALDQTSDKFMCVMARVATDSCFMDSLDGSHTRNSDYLAIGKRSTVTICSPQ